MSFHQETVESLLSLVYFTFKRIKRTFYILLTSKLSMKIIIQLFSNFLFVLIWIADNFELTLKLYWIFTVCEMKLDQFGLIYQSCWEIDYWSYFLYVLQTKVLLLNNAIFTSRFRMNSKFSKIFSFLHILYNSINSNLYHPIFSWHFSILNQ